MAEGNASEAGAGIGFTSRAGWELDAACRDSELFRAPLHEPEPARVEREAAAKLVCARCPVRAACLEYALRVREPYGIWGGLTQGERLDLRSARAS